MYASHLCKLACGDPFIKNKFGGVFPCDGLPAHKAGFLYFIVNLDPKHLPGSHWIAIAFKKDIALYFDSYGRAPMQKDILTFLRRNARIIKYNTIMFQNFKSTSCGLFSLYFLYKISRNSSINKLHLNNTFKNEILMAQFLKRKLKFGKCCHNAHVSKQTCKALINMKTTNNII